MLIKLGTRSSPLALKQVEEIKKRMEKVNFEVIEIATKGDKDKTTPLHEFEGSDFFTHEIERALIEGRIDAALHSAKDLETELPEELTLAAVTASIDPFDSLVSVGGVTLDKLPSGSRVGTSSQSRKDAIKRFRPDLIVKDIRGNVDERIKKLDKGEYEAIIVANAALIRLGLESRVSQVLPFSVVKSHPLQGKLAVQVRKKREDLINLFEVIDGS